MTAFWIAAGVLTLASLALVLWPLWRRRRSPPPSWSESALRLYRAQLAALDREADDGLLAAAEAERLRAEIKRRMLTAAERDGSAAPTRHAPSRGLAVVLAMAIAVAAVAGYAVLGSPGAPDRPLAGRAPPPQVSGLAPEDRQVAENAVAMLAARLAERPDDATAWRLLGRSLRALGRLDDAAAAYRRALAAPGGDPAVGAELGDVLVAAAGGRVGAEAVAAFEAALAHDPDDPRARYYLALRRAQEGDIEGALEGWLALIARAPADAPWLPQVRQQAARAAAALGRSIDEDAEAPPPAAGGGR